jgi:hypothetical protein
MMRMLAQLPMDPLSGLRDIHLPPPPPVWPPAPGWWLLALLATGAVAVAVRHAFLSWRRGAARRAAVRSLADLRDRFHNGEAPEVLTAELSKLLRRAAMVRHPRARVAGLTGDDWLAFLDDDEHRFSEGVGTCLVSAPYARAANVDLEALLVLCEKWVRRHA